MLADPTDVQNKAIRPVLKWAGGKRQLLPELIKRMPTQYGTYLEPFLGGGALFFHLQPKTSVISDANDELMNLYTVIATDLDGLLTAMHPHKNDSDYFYQERAKDWTSLTPVLAAARTLFLNRTCFNGLYRVNKKGQFNVPFGKYTNPKICDAAGLAQAAELLKQSTIVDGDYKQVLHQHAKANDFIFLDPPYHPVSQYSDFKRYTKAQFGEPDQIDLASEVAALQDKGCHVLLTNSNSELILDLYQRFRIDAVDAKRNINSMQVSASVRMSLLQLNPKSYM